MFDIFCVTNRNLCRGNFFARLERIAAEHPAGIILREKDLDEAEYAELAERTIAICSKYGTPCILHSFWKTAEELRTEGIHLPLRFLREMKDEERKRFRTIGVSCHSVEETREAERLGGTYLTVGNIFETACKKDLPGRGLGFLKTICAEVSIPVYAIGGISKENIAAVRTAGAAGACVMSGVMQCENVGEYLRNLIR